MSTSMKLIATQDMSKTLNILASLIPLTRPQLIQRALKKAGLFFGLAVASVFIPVFHFVLVPLFLIVSGVAFFKQFSPTAILKLDHAYGCVQCAKPLKTEYTLKEDEKLECEECHCRYLIEGAKVSGEA